MTYTGRKNYVVHLSAECHAMVTEYCQRQRVALKHFVESLIKREVRSHRAVERLTNTEDAEQVWERPAFWERENG
jgi:hypothetical protein